MRSAMLSASDVFLLVPKHNAFLILSAGHLWMISHLSASKMTSKKTTESVRDRLDVCIASVPANFGQPALMADDPS